MLGELPYRELRKRYAAPFEVFLEGENRHAHNRMGGTIEGFGRSLTVETGDFRYKFPESRGDDAVNRFSYLLAAIPFKTDVPAIIIRRERLLDKLVGILGFDDIDFESEEFSRRFHVASFDRRFAHGLLDGRMIQFLLDSNPPRIELRDGFLLLVSDHGRTRWTPHEFTVAIRWTRDFLERWPVHLIGDLLASP